MKKRKIIPDLLRDLSANCDLDAVQGYTSLVRAVPEDDEWVSGPVRPSTNRMSMGETRSSTPL